MSNENNKPAKPIHDNVLQFPGPKAAPQKASPPPAPKAKAKAKPEAKPAKSVKKTTAGTVLAIALMTIAVNKYTFETQNNSLELSSAVGQGRAIASVDHLSFTRDAAWEKDLAERLASPHVRQTASINIGRAATKEEKLRWGILEEKYTINYDAIEHKISSIFLQGDKSSPSYLLDRSKFLNEYGQLFHEGYKSAKLKSVEKSDDKTFEAYTLFDKENNPKGELRFELDRHKRLISLKVEPIQI